MKNERNRKLNIVLRVLLVFAALVVMFAINRKYDLSARADGAASENEVSDEVSEDRLNENSTQGGENSGNENTDNEPANNTLEGNTEGEGQTIELTVFVSWNDCDDQDGKRPRSVSVNLYKDQNEIVRSVSLNEANQWRVTERNLPVSINSVDINYTWGIAAPPEEYPTITSETDGNTTTFTLKHDPETTVETVSINWVDNNDQYNKRPRSVTATLKKRLDTETTVGTVSLNATNNWKWTEVDLPKYEEKREIEYTWTLDTSVFPAGYTVSGPARSGSVTTFTNTYNESSIAAAQISLSERAYTYTGQEIMPAVTVSLNGAALREGTDYTISYSNNINVGTANVKIEGKGSYTGIKNETFAINPKSINDADVTLDQIAYEYTGKEIKPGAIVKVGGRILTEGTDYTLSYKNNTSVALETDIKAPPSVIVTGKGNYTGEKAETFSIIVTDITAKNEKNEYFYKITFDKVSYVYSGDEYKPSPKVVMVMDKTVLKKDTDYTVSYANNKDAGSKSTTSTYPTVTIKGKGIYSGKRTFAFTISPKSIASASITLSKGTSVSYTGSEITNSISKVELNGVTLSEGTDYEIDSSSVKSATTSGTYQIKIKGKGNYNNTASARWTINRPSSTTSSSTRTTASSSIRPSSSTNYGRTTSSSTKTSGTSSSNSAKTKTSGSSSASSSSTASGNKTVSGSNARIKTSSPSDGDSVSSGEGEADTDDTVSENLFSDGDIKKETYNKGAAKKHTYDGSKNGTIENLLTPAPGYENDGPVHASVEDVQAVGEAILAGDFRDAVEDGSELEIWVDVKPAEDTVSDEEKSLAEKYIMSVTDKVAGLCIGRYLDVSVFFRIDQGIWEEADETRVPVAIDFSVPDSMQDQSDRYYVLCIHDGQVEFMSDINNDTQMITVMTQWLNATYVLLYQDMDAAAAGEVYGPKEVSLYTVHDSFDFGPKTEVKKKSHPKALALCWFISSILVLGGYGIWEAIRSREAVKAMLNPAASKSA